MMRWRWSSSGNSSGKLVDDSPIGTADGGAVCDGVDDNIDGR